MPQYGMMDTVFRAVGSVGWGVGSNGIVGRDVDGEAVLVGSAVGDSVGLSEGWGTVGTGVKNEESVGAKEDGRGVRLVIGAEDGGTIDGVEDDGNDDGAEVRDGTGVGCGRGTAVGAGDREGALEDGTGVGMKIIVGDRLGRGEVGGGLD